MGSEMCIRDRTNTVMIMYRPVKNSVIVLGDPIGKKENFVEAIDDFIVYCNEYHMNVCFYEINGENLELYCDQGFRFVKVGQDATVDLTQFSLVGKKNRTWRHVLNLSLIHISEPTRPSHISRMPSSA